MWQEFNYGRTKSKLIILRYNRNNFIQIGKDYKYFIIYFMKILWKFNLKYIGMDIINFLSQNENI